MCAGFGRSLHGLRKTPVAAEGGTCSQTCQMRHVKKSERQDPNAEQADLNKGQPAPYLYGLLRIRSGPLTKR